MIIEFTLHELQEIIDGLYSLEAEYGPRGNEDLLKRLENLHKVYSV